MEGKGGIPGEGIPKKPSVLRRPRSLAELGVLDRSVPLFGVSLNEAKPGCLWVLPLPRVLL